MKNLKNNFSKRITKVLNYFLIGSALLGFSTLTDKAEASAPPLCKDVLGVKDSNGKYSKDKDDIAGNVNFCSDTPDRFEMTIYELGLCTSAPFTSASRTFNRDTGNCSITMTSTGSVADIASSTVSLPNMTGRPTTNDYQYAYIIIQNTFGLRGSIKIDDGSGGTSEYCSDGDGIATNAAATCTGLDHLEELDDFGDSEEPVEDQETGFSAYFPVSAGSGPGGSEPMSGGGGVTALLVTDDLTTSTVRAETTKLIGLFTTDVNNKVKIQDTTNGLEIELQVTDIGYAIEFQDNGEPDNFGSMPFKPIFNTF